MYLCWIEPYVAGALGKASLIKQEDSGDLYSLEDNVLAPDYRITLNDGKQYLVEVKNNNSKNPSKPLTIKKSYYEKLERYADLNNLELKLAYYFSSWNVWVLLSHEYFSREKGMLTISFGKALACSEMNLLGDCSVGTTPNLEIHLMADPEEAKRIDDNGDVQFVAREIKYYCAGKEIISESEQKIAFYFMQYGDWIEQETEAIVKQNRLYGIKFVYAPEQKEDQGFTMVGNLSSMITRAYKMRTQKNGSVSSLKIDIDPSVFEILIPTNYKSENLPLWRFNLKPNPSIEL